MSAADDCRWLGPDDEPSSTEQARPPATVAYLGFGGGDGTWSAHAVLVGGGRSVRLCAAGSKPSEVAHAILVLHLGEARASLAASLGDAFARTVLGGPRSDGVFVVVAEDVDDWLRGHPPVQGRRGPGGPQGPAST
jgi:hypothetical protein